MKNQIISIIVILIVGLAMYSCESSQHEQEAHEDHEEEGHENTVSLSKQQMEVIGLKLVQLKERNLSVGVEASGKMELAPQDKADISPLLGGIVKEVKVFEGDKVVKGQVLATLEHPDFIQLQQDYVNNINTLEYLEKEYERQKRLYEEKVGSGKEFQKTRAEYNNSKATVAALKVKLRMLGINASEVGKGRIYPTVNIVAPMKGIVSLVETNVGAFAEPLTKVFEIVDNDKIHADLMVYEKDINLIKVGQKILFNTSSLAGQELEGKIYAISPAFEENPKAVHVHAKILTKNKAFIPGMYIQGRIISDNILVSTLPEHAIVEEEGKSYIFVKTDEHHEDEHGKEESKNGEHAHDDEGKMAFEKIEVITGIMDGSFVEVKLLSPLPDNVQIAGNGAYYLLAEMGKGETEHSH